MENEQGAQTQNALRLNPPSMPLNPSIEKEFGITVSTWRVLVDQIFPNAQRPEAIEMALAYCRERNLDIMKRPVHIVPMYSSALKRMVETVWPGISEIRTTASRTGLYAGIDEVVLGPMVTHNFEGKTGGKDSRDVKKTVTYPEWASVVVYKMVAGVRCPFHTKIYWLETFAGIGKTGVPNDMWGRRPIGQFDKCLEAAALRKAFPEELGSTYAAEEMEGRDIDHATVEQRAQASAERTEPPNPHEEEQGRGGKVVDAEFEEVEEDEQAEAKAKPNGKTVAEDQEEASQEDTGAPDPDADDDGDDDNADEYFFEKLREAMLEAETIEDVEEVWTNSDPMARFEGDDLKQKMAVTIKNMRLKQIEKKKAK